MWLIQSKKIIAPILFLLSITSSNANEIKSKHLLDKVTGLDAIVLTIPAELNQGFAVIDVPVKKKGDNILSYWNSSKLALIINGGYFEHDFSPTGLCKINGKVINKTQLPNLSGFVVVDYTGRLSILTHSDKLKNYPTILQTGPFVIDPGGKVGIKSHSGVRAKRTLIGLDKQQSIVIVITEPIDLFDLAHSIKKNLPGLDRLLNLDGGPSTALKTLSDMVVNTWPVRNYIIKAIQ